MKIALISHSFPPHMTGGIGSYTFSLAEALSKKGIDVTVFCGGKVREELKSTFKIKRMPMLSFPPRALWFQLQNYKKLARELKNFDIIHGQNTSSSFCVMMKEKLKKPWIVTFHDCPMRGLKAFFESPVSATNLGDFFFNVAEYPLYKKLYSIDLRHADKIISVGNSLLFDLKRHFKFDIKKAKIVQNGVNIKKIDKIIKKTKIKNEKKNKIIFLGRLFYGKGLTFLIESMKEVVKYDKNVVLDIYGDGPLRKHIEKTILANQLTGNVRLHHFIPNELAITEIYKSDLLVLPSLYEAFPIVVLEAMACKKPVVGVDTGGINEIINNNKNGLLVPPKDSGALAKAILTVIKNPELGKKLGENGYKKVKENFTWAIQADKTIELYKEALKDKKK